MIQQTLIGCLGTLHKPNPASTWSLPKTSPFAMLYSREYAICPAAPVTRTLTGSGYSKTRERIINNRCKLAQKIKVILQQPLRRLTTLEHINSPGKLCQTSEWRAVRDIFKPGDIYTFLQWTYFHHFCRNFRLLQMNICITCRII